MSRKLQLALRGEGISVARLATALHELSRILQDIDVEVSGKITLAWGITGLRLNGAIIETSPRPIREGTPDFGPKVIHAFVSGMREINTKPARPQYFTDEVLVRAKKLASLLNDGVERVSISDEEHPTPVIITQRLAANVDELIGVKDLYLGSVEGRLEILSVHGGFSFAVYDALTGRKVICQSNPETLKEIIDTLGSDVLGARVLVTGEVRTDVRGHPISVSVDNYRVLRETSDLPQVEDVKGILSDSEFDATEFGDYLRGDRDGS